MASIEIRGTIRTIKHIPNGVLVYINEPKCGYKKKDGTKVDSTVLEWKCIFNKNTGVNIDKFFNTGNYVTVRGDVLPYRIENGNFEDGYTVMAYIIHWAAFPQNAKEKKMQKESQSHSTESPDLYNFKKEDF